MQSTLPRIPRSIRRFRMSTAGLVMLATFPMALASGSPLGSNGAEPSRLERVALDRDASPNERSAAFSTLVKVDEPAARMVARELLGDTDAILQFSAGWLLV